MVWEKGVGVTGFRVNVSKFTPRLNFYADDF